MRRKIVQYFQISGKVIHSLYVKLAQLLDLIPPLQLKAEVIESNDEHVLVGFLYFGTEPRAELEADQEVGESSTVVPPMEVVYRFVQGVHADMGAFVRGVHIC